MSRCRKCNQPIGWRKLPSGKWLPINPDGGDHFDDCSKHRHQNLVLEYRKHGLEYEPEQARMRERAEKLFLVEPDRSQPWFVDERSPWRSYAPTHCECGCEYVVTARDCEVTLRCVTCPSVRIESSFSLEFSA